MIKKKERHEIYKNILQTVKKEGWGNLGFCRLIRDESGIDVYWRHEMKENFPEIEKYRVDKKYWFPLNNEKDPIREKILKEAIRLTKPKSNGVSKRRGNLKGTSVSKASKRNRKSVGIRRVAKRVSKTS